MKFGAIAQQAIDEEWQGLGPAKEAMAASSEHGLAGVLAGAEKINGSYLSRTLHSSDLGPLSYLERRVFFPPTIPLSTNEVEHWQIY